MRHRYVPRYSADPLLAYMGNRNRKPSGPRSEAAIMADLGISPQLMEELNAEVEAEKYLNKQNSSVNSEIKENEPMSLTVADNGGGDFERAPEGTHLATCYMLADIGTQATTYQGQEKHQKKIIIGWELPHEPMSDGRPFAIT